MNQMIMLFVQTNLGLPPGAGYAALIAGLVGVVVGVFLAWLFAKLYPPKEERARNGKTPARTASSQVKTYPPQAADSSEIAGEDADVSNEAAPSDPSLEAVRETCRQIGSSLGANIATLTGKLEGLDPLLRGDGGRDEQFLTAVNNGFTDLRAELSQLNQTVSSLPTLVHEAVGRHFEEERGREAEARRQKEEQVRREREEVEKKRRGELEQRKRARRDGFIRRYEELRKSDLMQASVLTMQIAQGLKRDSTEPLGFEDLLPPYARLIEAANGVLRELKRPDLFAGDDLEDAAGGVEARFEEVEAAWQELETKHKPAWLVDLLEKARGHGHLEERAQQLKELLDLEDVAVSIGTELEARHMDDVEVVEAKGYGKRKIICEVLGNGYRVKETGMVIRKPQVAVRLEG